MRRPIVQTPVYDLCGLVAGYARIKKKLSTLDASPIFVLFSYSYLEFNFRFYFGKRDIKRLFFKL